MSQIAIEVESPELEPRRIRGRWWLPHTPDVIAPGELSFVPGGEITLDVQGKLGGEASGGTGIVLGTENGRPVTLAGAHPLSYQGTGFGPSYDITGERWRANQALLGVHASTDEEARFGHFSLMTGRLPVWTNKPMPEGGLWEQSGISLRVDLPHPISTEIPAGRLTLSWQASEAHSGRRSVVSVRPIWHLEASHPLSIDEAWDRLVIPSLFLTSFVSGGADRITHFAAAIPDDDIVGHLHEVEILTPTWTGPAPAERSNHFSTQLLPFDETDPPVLLRRWHQLVDTAREPLMDFFIKDFAPHTFIEEEFIRAVRSLEAWHRVFVGGAGMPTETFSEVLRKVETSITPTEWELLSPRLRFANEPTLKQRLDALMANADEPLSSLIKKYRRFARRVVDTRNSLAHDGKRGTAFDLVELAWAVYTLRHLTTLLILRELGYSASDVRAAVERTSDWRLLASPQNRLLYEKEYRDGLEG